MNRTETAVQKLYTARKGNYRRRLAVGPSNTWLAKRRDGRSKFWMVAWYDPDVRSIRYRSTRTSVLKDAREVLARFQLPDGVRSLPPAGLRKSKFIYFIGGDTGAIKIGMAYDLIKRLADLQCGSPIRLSILASGPGGRKDEAFYHQRFAAHRLHGEWFERHPDILAEIERLSLPLLSGAGA